MQKAIYLLTIFLTPLLFATFTANFFSTPKQLLVILAILLTLIAVAFRLVIKKQLELSTSKLSIPLAIFTIMVILNLAVNPIGRLEALVGPAILYLTLSLWAYLLSMEHDRSFSTSLIYVVLGSTAILALYTLAQLTFLTQLPGLPDFMQTRSFTLTGSTLTTLTLLVMGALTSLYLTLKHRTLKLVFAISSVIHLIALIALGALMMPTKELALSLFPLGASWQITLDALKSARTFFLGIGLSNYSAFFTSVKPLFLNSTPFWNTIPSTASSELMQITTTLGVVALVALLAMPLLALRSEGSDSTTLALKLLTLLTLIALFLTPGSLPLLIIFFSCIGVLSSRTPRTYSLPSPLHFILCLLISSFVGLVGYYSSRLVIAEHAIHQAQVALIANDGKSLYENSLSAVTTFPTMMGYRLSYSQVNLSLATSLSQKKTLSDEERTNVTTLVSQAVREGKAAVSLSPNSSMAWQNLGNIYQKLISVAGSSDQFAVEAYSQAVKLDPGNAGLRLDFGALLYQLATTTRTPADQNTLYAQAQNEFQVAIQLKPDYTNAYYNLAKLLESTKDYANSATVMQKAISLLGPDSPELTRINGELDAIKAKIQKP